MTESFGTQQCPSCSRVVYFTHGETTLLQCTCGVVIERIDGVLRKKEVPVIQYPASVIQPGTEGKWQEKSFRVSGRFRVWMAEAVFNYWTIVFNDGAIGYLGEGYGLYAIYEKKILEPGLSSALLDDMKIDAQRNLYNGEKFLLENIQQCYQWEIEGEVYLPKSLSSFRVFEFAAQDGKRIEAIEWDKNNIHAYIVSYVSFSSLAFAHLRTWEPHPKKVLCLQCSKQNTLHTYPYAQSFACIHCRTRYTLEKNGEFKRLPVSDSVDATPGIALGASAEIKGIQYQVLGFACKEEDNINHAQWKEYTLFNPQEGFASLSEFDGNWAYVREQGRAPVLSQKNLKSFEYEREAFRLFNRYTYKTVTANAEFSYNLFNDKEKEVMEFIAPPNMWIREKSPTEGIKWFLGEHISGEELQAAFGQAIILPYKVGIGAVEPKGFVPTQKVLKVTVAAFFILLLVHLISTLGRQERIILEQQYVFDSLHTISFVTPKFSLDKWRSNLQFDMQAPVDNSWFELNANLVDATTGKEYSIGRGVEYYHGYSDGESWAEGSTRETVYLQQIPRGTYYLQVNGTREKKYIDNSASEYITAGVENLPHFSLTVTYDSPNHRNFFVCVITLLITAFVQNLLLQHYEKTRWSNSPFSQYESAEHET